jgi:hypothetical protein
MARRSGLNPAGANARLTPVERASQRVQRPAARPDPRQSIATPTMFVGMDVHTSSFSRSTHPGTPGASGSTEIRPPVLARAAPASVKWERAATGCSLCPDPATGLAHWPIHLLLVAHCQILGNSTHHRIEMGVTSFAAQPTRSGATGARRGRAHQEAPPAGAGGCPLERPTLTDPPSAPTVTGFTKHIARICQREGIETIPPGLFVENREQEPIRRSRA